MARTKVASIPEVGDKAPEFNLPSAQGGQLRLSMRTARGPVVVVFYRVWFEEDVEYFKALAEKEDEINMASASVVGIGVAEPDEARQFVQESGINSYVLYDYARIASREWGLLEKNKEHGDYVRPAVFIVGSDHEIVHAWTDERPEPGEILTKVNKITGLPEPPEEEKEEEEEEAESEESQETEKSEARPEKGAAEAEEAPKEEKPSEKSAEGQEAPKSQAATDDETGEPGPEESSERGESESRTEDEKKAGE